MNERSTEKQLSTSGRHERRVWRKRWFQICAGLLALLIVLIVAYFTGPAIAARAMLAQHFEEIGAESHGIETLEVDMWNRRIRFGPVMFHLGNTEPARLDSVSVGFSIGQLIGRRAFIEDIEISGVDLLIDLDRDDGVVINGVPLGQFGDDQTSRSEDTGKSWGVGISDFVLTNSNIVVRPPNGRELVIAADNLKLDSFRSWDPENPGTFEFSGNVNDMKVAAHGSVRSFSEPMTATIEEQRMEEVEFLKIQQFTGPMGFSSRKGSVSAEIRHDVRYHADSTLQISSKGSLIARDAVLETERGTAEFGEARMEGQGDFELRPDGSKSLRGDISLRGTPLALRLIDGAELVAGEFAIEFPDLEFVDDAKRFKRITGRAHVAADEVVLQGPNASSLDRIEININKFESSNSAEQIELTIDANMIGEQLYLTVASGDESADLELDAFQFSFPNSRTLFGKTDSVAVFAQPEVVLDGIQFRGETIASLDRVQLAFQKFDAQSGRESMTAGLTGEIHIQGFEATLPEYESRPSACSASRIPRGPP